RARAHGRRGRWRPRRRGARRGDHRGVGAAPPLRRPRYQRGRDRGGMWPARRRILAAAGAAGLALACSASAMALTLPRFGAPLPLAVPAGPGGLIVGGGQRGPIPGALVPSHLAGRRPTTLGVRGTGGA